MILKNRLLLFALLLFSIAIQAQQGPGRERIKTLKVAFITEQLNLSSKEAQKFWPVYNDYEEKMDMVRQKEREQFGGRFADMSQITSKEADNMVAAFTKLQAEKHQLEQDFIKNLQGVLPSIKILKLFRAEENFKKRLLQQIRKRRGGGQ